MSLEDVRRGGKRWEDIRWADMSCGELRRVETSCENLRKAKISWDEMGWPDRRRVVKSWEEPSWDELRRMEELDVLRKDEKSSGDVEWRSYEKLRRAEQGREDMRWDEMRWKKLRRREMDELRWDGMTPTAVIMGCNESKRSCYEMRSDKMRKDSIFKRHGTRVASQELAAAKHRRLGRHL